MGNSQIELETATAKEDVLAEKEFGELLRRFRMTVSGKVAD